MPSVRLSDKQREVLRKTLGPKPYPGSKDYAPIAHLVELGLVEASYLSASGYGTWTPTQEGRAWLAAHPPAKALGKGCRVLVHKGCEELQIGVGDIAVITDVEPVSRGIVKVVLDFEGRKMTFYARRMDRLNFLRYAEHEIQIAPC